MIKSRIYHSRLSSINRGALMILNHQREFIEFLLQHHAIKFGEFTLKSGRISPYFFNLGTFNSGASLTKLGEFYAETLQQSGFNYDVLFGPAYKGIPLVCATNIALFNKYQIDAPYCFNRKEKKDHGDTGSFVGAPLQGQVVMVDDVITAGTTVRETIAMLETLNAKLTAIIIAFDRQEKGSTDKSAIQEAVERFNVPVQSIITLNDLIFYLEDKPGMQEQLARIREYQERYGT